MSSDRVLFDTVISHLADQGWSYTPLEGERDVVQIKFAIEGAEWLAYAQVWEEQEEFAFFSVYPSPVPDHARAATAALLAQINFYQPLGQFQMDWTDGELRYKTAICVKGDRLTRALVENVIQPNLQAMTDHFERLGKVMTGEASASQAMDQSD